MVSIIFEIVIYYNKNCVLTFYYFLKLYKNEYGFLVVCTYYSIIFIYDFKMLNTQECYSNK